MEVNDKIKFSHELFVSGHNGTSPLEVIIAVLPVVPGAALSTSFTIESKLNILTFCVEYFFCIIPIILTFTICSDIALEVNAIMFLLLLLRLTYQKKEISTYVKDNGRISYLTASRATVNIATIIAILAVDFHIFPRRFAKTETYGYSLMDVGAACFLFMNGISDAKKRESKSLNTLKSAGILILLGVLRFLSIRSTNYQEHISEYGIHCNFFFSLAAVKILCFHWAASVSDKIRRAIVFCLATCHELGLRMGLAEWTVSDISQRVGILEANKEWIVSLPGNVLIYLLGILYGTHVFEEERKKSKTWKGIIVPFAPMLITFLLKICFGLEPSRRLSNIAFVSWIVGFFTFYATFFKVVSSLIEGTCHIFRAVNSYPLMFFLAGNLLTGLINISINTLEVTNVMAFMIINFYCFTVCYIIYCLYTNFKVIKSKPL